MKIQFFIANGTLAFLCLISCQKQTAAPGEIIPVDEEYVLEITGIQETKDMPASVNINLADLKYKSVDSFTAQLKRKNGKVWDNITKGVDYSWSTSASDRKNFTFDVKSDSRQCEISAKSAGSGVITVSALLDGVMVASRKLSVTVDDSREYYWNKLMSVIPYGNIYFAELNSSFSGSATVCSNSGSLLLGTSPDNMSSTVSVDFTDANPKKIYYMYNASQTTVIEVSVNSSTGDVSKKEKVQIRYPKWKTASKKEMEDVYLDNVYNLGSSTSLSRGEILAMSWNSFNFLWGVHDFNAMGMGETLEDLDSQMESSVLYDFYKDGYPYSACDELLGCSGIYIINMYRQRLGLQ